MRNRYSLFLPVAAILTGVVMELNSLHLLGNLLPNELLAKIWPVLLVFVGLDLLLSQRRIVGSVVVFFTAAALLSTQFMDGGWNNEVWKLFMKVWPILLILFGLDWIFSGRSLINAAVIIAGVIILVYVLFTFLDVPVLKKLPFNLNLESIIPTSVFNGEMPQPSMPGPNNNNMPQMFSQPTENENIQPIINGPDGQIIIAMPSQNSAALNINAASGKVSLKSGGASNQFVSGSVQLDSAEKISHTAETNGNSARYTLRSDGKASANNVSNWDLSVTPERSVALNAVLNNGYIKADLRSLNLSSVSIENKYGPIDVMMPVSTNAPVKIISSFGDIRVYVPRGAVIQCTITGAKNIEYPQYTYALSGNTLSPVRAQQTPIRVEIKSNNGLVRIIETQ